MENSKNYISEILGTFILVFCGTSAMAVNDITNGAVTHVGIGITWGFIVIAMIYAFGDISGAHFNPAVTIAFAFAKKFQWQEVPKYLTSQFIGAITASIVVWYLFPESENLGGTHTILPPFKAFIVELLLTFILMLVIINVSTGSKETGIVAGIAIGGVVMLEALFAGPITNASMNPIRSLAPAIMSGKYDNLWLYLTAPIIGALLAVVSCKLVKKENCCSNC